MSVQSDEETMDRQSIGTLQQLINQSRIKDIALSKATNLIDLLTLELQTQRIKRLEQVRQVEEQLRQQFQKEILLLNQKIQFLQRQLKRSNTVKTVAVSNQRNPTISRTNSSKSLSVKRKKSNNKKYTEMNTQENNCSSKQNTFQLKAMEEYLLNFQDWKETVVDDFNGIALNDYQQLKDYLDRVDQAWLEIDYTFAQPINPIIVEEFQWIKNQNSQMRKIIGQQQKFINGLKAFIQDLQDTYKPIIFKLSNSPKTTEQKYPYIDMHNLIVDLKVKACEGKRHWQKKHSTLLEENNELKNILEGIINLLQMQRKSQF